MCSARRSVVRGVRCSCVSRLSFFFNYCFWVRPKGIKETEELVDGDQLDPVSFLASVCPNVSSLVVCEKAPQLLVSGCVLGVFEWYRCVLTLYL